jgi:hypothetical protein
MPRPDLSELGSTGLLRTGGTVYDEFLSDLRGPKGRKTLREMSDNEPIIASFLFAIEKILQRLDWHFEPYRDPTADGEPDDADIENAQFANDALNDMSMSWDHTLSEILSMLVYGWSYLEIVYKKRVGPDQKDGSKRSKHTDGKIGWRRWGIRSQETLQEWLIDPEDGGVAGMIQLDPVAGGKGRVTIPIEKSLLFRTSVRRNNPEGKPLIRTAYVPYYYKKVISEIEAIGIERDLAGLPVLWLHPDYFAADAPPEMRAVYDTCAQIVKSVKRNENEGILMPLMYDEQGNRLMDLTLLSSGGSRQIPINDTITRYNQMMAITVLADFILLGHERVGTYSLGASKVDLWSLGVDAIANSIREVIQSYAVPRLFAYNGIPLDRLPQFVYGDVAQVELTEIADFVQKMAGAGVLAPDDDLEDYMRDLAGFPPANKEAREERHAQAEAMAQMAEDAAAGGGAGEGADEETKTAAPGKADDKPGGAGGP